MDSLRLAIETEYNWSDEDWRWNPELGRWQPDYGRPQCCVELRLATSGHRNKDAYDFWRNTVFYNFEADSIDPDDVHTFSARLSGVISPRVEFYEYESDAISGRRTKKDVDSSDSDDIDIGIVFSGQRSFCDSDGTEGTAGSGEFFIYDSSQPSVIEWDKHQAAHLSFRRKDLEEALGNTLPNSAYMRTALQTSPLAPFLHNQIAVLHQHISNLGDWERDIALDQIMNLTVNVLRSALAKTDHRISEHERLFNFARWFIEENLSHPGLSVTVIARKLGCSRSTLYRCFDSYNFSVAGYIRERRLLTLRNRLRTASLDIPIAEIAANCGLYDAPNVSRLFRARFGVPPSALRPSELKPIEASSEQGTNLQNCD